MRNCIFDFVLTLSQNRTIILSDTMSENEVSKQRWSREDMPRGSEELTESRKEEIVNACAKLYQTMNYRDITIKEISTETSFSRPSIYNYFETKEEIFLALLTREYHIWAKDVLELAKEQEKLTKNVFAARFSEILANRVTLLKISSMNLYEIEDHSRLERLVEFKKEFLCAMDAVKRCLQHFFPDMTEAQIEGFRYAFFPFMYGIYPYVFPTDKQREAMKMVGIPFQKTTVYDMVLHFLIQILP